MSDKYFVFEHGSSVPLGFIQDDIYWAPRTPGEMQDFLHFGDVVGNELQLCKVLEPGCAPVMVPSGVINWEKMLIEVSDRAPFRIEKE